MMVSFWIGVFALVVNTLMLMCSSWPRSRSDETVGERVDTALLSFAFMVWAGILLWGCN